MAKKAKQPDSEGDDDVYLEVKQELSDSTNRQKSVAGREQCGTPAANISTPSRHSTTDATPFTGTISKETKAALKIVRKHAPSTPLDKTAVDMITEHVLASQLVQPEKGFGKSTFGFIEEKLSQKKTPRSRLALVVEHVRAEVGSTLARRPGQVIENKNDLDHAILAVRSAFEDSKAKMAGDGLTLHKIYGETPGRSAKRKRASSIAEVTKPSVKLARTDESSYTVEDTPSTKTKRNVDMATFLTFRKPKKIARHAKSFFDDSQRLFDFHVLRLYPTSEHETKRKPGLIWSSLSPEQQGE